MSKKLTDIDVNESSFLNDSFEDLYDSSEADSLEGDFSDSTDDGYADYDSNEVEITGSTEEQSEQDEEYNDSDDTYEEEEEEGDYDEDYDDSEESLDDYNTLGVLALTLREQEPDLIDFDIEKDIEPEVFVNKLRGKLHNVRENIQQSVEEQYGHAAEYLRMIINGANNGDIQQAVSLNQIASLDVDEVDDDEILENVVVTWLNSRGTPDAEDLVEVYKDKGILNEKAKEGVEYFRQQEAAYIQNWEYQRHRAIQEQQVGYMNYQKAVRDIINRGSVKGLAIRDKQKFEESLFRPTELIQFIDEEGNQRTQKVPLLQVKMENFKQDLEQQLALQLLILDDFDFTSLVDKAKRKVNNNLLETLNKRVNTSSGSRKRSKYFED